MGFGHWLSAAWDRNRDFAGNALKNISPALSFVPGLGIPASFAAGALGKGIQHGSNLGDILKSGASNAAIGGGARSLVNGAQALAGRPASSAAFAPSSGVEGGGLPMPPPPITTPARGLSDVAQGIGGFAKDNATVLGQVGSGVLNARAGDEANALKTRQLDFEQQQYLDEQQRKKNLAALLGPLAQQVMSQQRTVAPNPYTSH